MAALETELLLSSEVTGETRRGKSFVIDLQCGLYIVVTLICKLIL
jgi:hypothetical protein